VSQKYASKVSRANPVEDSRNAEALARSRGETSACDADDEAAEGRREEGEEGVDSACGGEVVGGFVGEGSEVEGGCVRLEH
jgi:biotin carboxyl carrier protein